MTAQSLLLAHTSRNNFDGSGAKSDPTVEERNYQGAKTSSTDYNRAQHSVLHTRSTLLPALPALLPPWHPTLGIMAWIVQVPSFTPIRGEEVMKVPMPYNSTEAFKPLDHSSLHSPAPLAPHPWRYGLDCAGAVPDPQYERGGDEGVIASCLQ